MAGMKRCVGIRRPACADVHFFLRRRTALVTGSKSTEVKCVPSDYKMCANQ